MDNQSVAADVEHGDGFGPTGGPCLIVAGPTASGKSALAVALAQACAGEIVNGDSMQVYRDLSILTARPTDAEMADIPHHLYGVLPPDVSCTAGLWLIWLHRLLPQIWARRQVPVVVGGTGLYLRSLISGIVPVPEVPDTVRQAVSADYDAWGPQRFAEALARLDPHAATTIPSANRQRMIRAMEVVRHTGRALSDWQACPHWGGLPVKPLVVVLDPDRAWLYDRCDRRFLKMLDDGAWDQVRALMADGVGPDAPVCRGLGTRALMAALDGALDDATAIAQAQRETRHYAKRQVTWFRHQLQADWRLHPPQDNAESAHLVASLAQQIRQKWGAADQ